MIPTFWRKNALPRRTGFGSARIVRNSSIMTRRDSRLTN